MGVAADRKCESCRSLHFLWKAIYRFILIRMLRLLTQIKEEINAVCFYGAAVRDQQATEDSIRFIQ